MRKNLLLLAAASLLFFSCKKNKSSNDQQSPETVTLKSVGEIDRLIRQTLQSKNEFNWNDAGDDVIWSAGQQRDKMYAIGYKPAGETNVENRLHLININNASWKQAKEKIIDIIYTEEHKTRPSLERSQVEVWPEEILPVIDVMIENYSTIQKLRATGLIRYIEPMGYEPSAIQPSVTGKIASSSGCGSNNAEPGLVNGVHYTVTTPNALVSWNYRYHGIEQAWTKSTGSGVKVFIIDTGTSPDQANLGSGFNQGASSGRTIEKIVTLPRSTFLGIPTGPVETPADGCGHGTSMAGACAAPRGTGGAMAGIAYNCNLVTCRAAADVYLDESRENKGVADAFTNAGNRTDVRIISMSMGRITSSSQIKDAVTYAYNKGKAIFCAGGTSFDWSAGWFGVIFPANMSQVQAVTGVVEGSNFSNCNECHKGAEIDFVVSMQRSADGVKPLSLAMTGNAPSTVGGSSVATASTAGMAALVWSRYPTLTRDQLIQRLIANSSRYPTKTSEYGWGLINVNTATN